MALSEEGIVERHYDAARWLLRLIAVVVVVMPLLTTWGYITLARRVGHTARNAYLEQCATNNDTRNATLDFLDGILQRSEAAYKAALASPLSTEQQKINAQRGLESLPSTRAEAERHFAPTRCTFPPSTTTTTAP
jgi:hypothetical protein